MNNDQQYQQYPQHRAKKKNPLVFILILFGIILGGVYVFNNYIRQDGQDGLNLTTKTKPQLNCDSTVLGVTCNIIAKDNYSRVTVEVIWYKSNEIHYRTDRQTGIDYRLGNTYKIDFNLSVTDMLNVKSYRYSIYSYN